MAETPQRFQVFVKPVGPVCNLACRYCYYVGKTGLCADGARPRMTDGLLEEYITQHIKASRSQEIRFSWHGGEPTLLGLEGFRTVVELQRKHLPPGRRIVNGLQTNGTFLDDDWCRFLSAERFAVGLSLDGPAELHDALRVTRSGNPTHQQVSQAFGRLRAHQIDPDILCVVSVLNVGHPARVYRYFRETGARRITFLPLVERQVDQAAGVSAHSVPAEVYGEFLCTIFDEWKVNDIGRVGVQIFDEAARTAQGSESAVCIFRRTCGDIPVVEHNGDFYSCDHYVDAAHRLGSIQDTPLADLLASPEQTAFGRIKASALPQCCKACDVRAMCNGGCPRNRFGSTPDGEAGLNYLCTAYKRFFRHFRAFQAQVAHTARQLEAVGDHSRRPQASGGRSRGPGRNDPCPCGSGRKYKRCCGAL